MISKNDFLYIIKKHQNFHKGFERLEKAFMGEKSYCSNLFESDWIQAECMMFDKIIDIFFTDEGSDLIFWYLYEDVDKIIYQKDKDDIYLNSLEDLYNYLINNKEIYLKCI